MDCPLCQIRFLANPILKLICIFSYPFEIRIRNHIASETTFGNFSSSYVLAMDCP
jgi:hypothetical protein